MKVLVVNDCDYYLYPENIKTLEEFVTYANTHMGRLVKMTMLRQEKCNHPFYIDEEKKVYYLNPSRIESVTEEEVTVLSRCEYDKRLQHLINDVCVNCMNFEDCQENDYEDVHDKMCLDGKCWDFDDEEEEEDDYE